MFLREGAYHQDALYRAARDMLRRLQAIACWVNVRSCRILYRRCFVRLRHRRRSHAIRPPGLPGRAEKIKLLAHIESDVGDELRMVFFRNLPWFLPGKPTIKSELALNIRARFTQLANNALYTPARYGCVPSGSKHTVGATCTGRCRKLTTSSGYAINVDDIVGKSIGWLVVKRMRSMPSVMAATRRAAGRQSCRQVVPS